MIKDFEFVGPEDSVVDILKVVEDNNIPKYRHVTEKSWVW